MRILIVEDEALVAMDLAECLERAGHEVMGPAATATEALALCQAMLPDLALLDINLRDGSDGVVLGRALFERWGLLVIFASGQLMEARQARDVALGCLEKPYRLQTAVLSVELAHAVLNGGKPVNVPAGFELFSTAE